MDVRQDIASAVSAALTPGPRQAEGYRFLEDIKQSSDKTWQSSLDIFLSGNSNAGVFTYSYIPEARMFGLQVVDDALQSRFESLTADQVVAIQSSLLEYVKREYIHGEAEGQLFYLRNKVVHTLFLLFMQSYTSTWPTFFESFISLLPSAASSSAQTPTYNPKTTDLLMRLLHEISVEISDNTLRLNKAHVRLTRDTDLRDAVRAKDAGNIADAVGKILAWALQKIDSPQAHLTSNRAVELASMAVGVLADYASWIDISLIVNPTHLPLLFTCLTSPHISIRLSASDLLFELVTKGMPPTDKLELLRIMNVEDIITQLLDADDIRRKEGKNDGGSNGTSNGSHFASKHMLSNKEEEQLEMFREKLARIANGMGLELTKIVDEASATDAQKETAKTGVLSLRPLALRFLSDEYDDTSLTIIPFLQSLLTIYKKEKKRSQGNHMSVEKADFLRALLQTVTQKMRYSTEEEWGGDNVNEEDAEDEDTDDDDAEFEDEQLQAFLETRKNLKTVFDAVAWIDWDLFAGQVKTLIFGILDRIDANNTASLAWYDVEVALYILYLFGEPASKEKGTNNLASFLAIPAEEVRKASRLPDYKIDYSSYPPSDLGELMLRTLQSNVASFPHPAVPLQLFECVSRYQDFFQLAPDTINRVLPVFLDARGMHQKQRRVRSRCFYLFNRFVHTARAQLQQNLTAQTVTDICANLEDLLIIKAKVPTAESPSEDTLTKAAQRGSFFDSQLYIYDALGCLISILSTIDPNLQVNLLTTLLEPLLRDIPAISGSPSPSPHDLLRLHHLIKAVGNVAYGFPELKQTTTTPDGQWPSVFQEATKVILEGLKGKSNVAVIREASLGAFKSIAGRIGEAALPLVAPLIDCLIDQLTAAEVVEFLPFIGMLCHRYKSAFADMLDLLIAPVFDRTYFFLEQPITGTDDIMQHSDLRRAYFNLLMSICNAGAQNVFFSTRNAPRLENLLQSIPHYLSNGALLLDQKIGLAVVNKLSSEWIKPISGSEKSVLPQYREFVYTRVVSLSLELPVRTNFDYGDAQAYMVIGEIAGLLKILQTLRGQEFTDYLTSAVFPSFGIPPETVQVFLQNLTSAADGRAFKKWLAPFFQKAKQSSNDKPYSVAHLLEVVPGARQ